ADESQLHSSFPTRVSSDLSAARRSSLGAETLPAGTSGWMPERYSASHTYMLPRPDTIDWSSSLTLMFCLRPLKASARCGPEKWLDRKSTHLNFSSVKNSYA